MTPEEAREVKKRLGNTVKDLKFLTNTLHKSLKSIDPKKATPEELKRLEALRDQAKDFKGDLSDIKSQYEDFIKGL